MELACGFERIAAAASPSLVLSVSGIRVGRRCLSVSQVPLIRNWKKLPLMFLFAIEHVGTFSADGFVHCA